jgi:hypothetical protein
MQKPASNRGCKDAQRNRKASWPLPSSHRRSSGRPATPSRGRENVPLGLPRAGLETGFYRWTLRLGLTRAGRAGGAEASLVAI